jgi:hypothetical protein
MSRQLTEHVRTTWYQKQRLCSATAAVRVVYDSPFDTPQYMTASPDGAGARGGWTGRWVGHVTIQGWGEDEVLALRALFNTLEALHLPVDPEARAIAAALAAPPATILGTPWEQRPLGVRGPKPRRKRTKWRDENGKRVQIYLDTLKRHADPNCQCKHCNPPNTDETDENE